MSNIMFTQSVSSVTLSLLLILSGLKICISCCNPVNSHKQRDRIFFFWSHMLSCFFKNCNHLVVLDFWLATQVSVHSLNIKLLAMFIDFTDFEMYVTCVHQARDSHKSSHRLQEDLVASQQECDRLQGELQQILLQLDTHVR